MKKYILSLLILTSAGNLAAENIDAITVSKAVDSNAGIAKAAQSLAGNEKLQLDKKSAALNKPKLTERIKAQVDRGFVKTKEIAAKAKAKVASGYNKSKDFVVRNYDKAKVKTQSTWEKIKSWFTGTNSEVKA